MLPISGSVLGIDVGFSPIRRSSAVCRLDWNQTELRWQIERFRAREPERESAILSIAGKVDLMAAAFDGPLRRGFDLIDRYRTAERILTRQFGAKIGKPGQSNSPVGKRLNAAANQCVDVVLKGCCLGHATHERTICEQAIVEAFPTSFLGVMIGDTAALTSHRGNRSDVFYEHLATSGAFAHLLSHLLPARILSLNLNAVTNHDDRAALICALTALAVAAGDFVAVGDADGWIILPPRSLVQDWAWTYLTANADEIATGCVFVAKP